MKSLHILLIYPVILANTCFAQFTQERSVVSKNYISNSYFNELRSSAQADDDVIWSEDFANGLDGNNPSNTSWSTAGANGSIWAFDTDGSNGQYAGNEPYTLESESAGNGWMIFDADFSNPGIPAQFSARNGQLVSPYIDLTNDTNITLKFEHAFRWCCDPDHELLVGVSSDNGVSWDNFVVNDNYVANELAETHETSIIISDYAGGEDSVLIRFDWGGSEQTASHYHWMIDDVKIIKTPQYYSLLVNNYVRFPSPFFGGTTYSITPLTQAQATAYYFGGIIENLGINDLDSARIIANIESAGFNSMSYGATLSSQSRDTLFCNQGFVPDAVGEFTGLVHGLDDNNQSTDTASLTFKVSEYEYARDRSDFNTSFGFTTVNGEGSLQIGNAFDIYEDAEIYSIKVYIDEATSPNAEAKATLNSRNIQSGDVNFEDETSTINVGQYRGQWIDFTFSSPYYATKGQVLIPTIYCEFTDGVDSVVIGRSGISGPGETMLQDIDGLEPGGTPGSWYRTTGTVMVRLNFDPDAQAPVSIEENKSINFNIYPNPNNGQFKLNLVHENSKDLNLSIQNILGQEIYTESFQSVRSFSKNIDLSHLEKGIYHITISEKENKSHTQKIIIQ